MELRNGTVVGQNSLPPQSRPLFEEGLRQIFSKWTALALAVEHQWGGTNSAEKAEMLIQDCLQWFYKKREHYADELEEELDDAILQDFNVEAEDNSPHMVAEAAVRLYQELVQGNMTYLEQLRQMSAGVQASKRQVVDADGTVMEADEMSTDSSDGEDGDDDDDAMDDGGPAPQALPLPPPPPPAPIVDEDGFTLVQKGARTRRGGRG